MKPVSSYMIFAAMIFVGVMAYSCGSDKEDDKDYSSGGRYTWDKDIAPIVKSDCSSSGCHGKVGPLSTVYEDDENSFEAAKTAVIARLSLEESDSGFMPKGATSYASEKKDKLISFLNQ
jgi:hypothetical protein